ncbi:MAG: multidrug transporter [Bacilli bacterium]|nr:multidrug transporter [Bacilli bacterium]
MYQVLESDWKLLKERIPHWQERYMARLLEEYKAIIESNKVASERFWRLNKRINKDKSSVGVTISLRRSNMLFHIRALIKDNVISKDELKIFSQELQEEMND